MSNNKSRKDLAIFVIVAGIIVTICGVINIFVYKEKSEVYLSVIGTVVNHAYKYDSEGHVLEADVVEYTVDNQDYKWQSNVYYNRGSKIGAEVEIKYNPENPADSYKASDKSAFFTLFAGILMTIVGGVFLVIYIKAENTLV